MRRLAPLAAVLVLGASQSPKTHRLEATPDTVAYGYYWSEAKPVLRIASGDIIDVDTLLTSTPNTLRRLGVPARALDDAAQDVFLVVHRRWDSFDSRWSSVETWLFGILMRVARNHRRSLRRRAWAIPSTGDVVEVVPSPAAGPAELVARREAVALLDRLLDSLDEDKRAIIVLVDVEQLSVPQAAESLEVNLNTAYWRLRTARTQLRKSLARFRASENRSETDKGGGASS